MPKKTPTYQLDYFRRGNFYNSTSDYKRFTTLDYNMESYVGIIGVGIIRGWTIEEVGSLKIQITPGKGIIDGYLGESPYVVKQRSAMVDGDREVDVFDENGDIPVILTPSEKTEYIRVVRLYDPDFDPTGPILNYYVKVVIPEEIILNDNSDNYLFAELKDASSHEPYPKLNDLQILIDNLGDPPNRGDYSSYASYKIALDAYNANLTIIHEYQWYLNTSNHYTAVSFEKTLNRQSSNYKIYLGKVVTRSGSISLIDTTGIEDLEGLRSQIERFAKDAIIKHTHGGSKSFDPQKIRLETDIRSTVLSNYNINTGRAVYNVIEGQKTSIEAGHQHTYSIDSLGNGVTLQQVGSGGNVSPHFHKIKNSIISSPEMTVMTVEDHVHTIVSESDNLNIWDSNQDYIVYVNTNEFGDESSTYVTTDAIKKKITFNGGISVTTNSYSVSFQIFGDTYSYTGKAYTVYEFMMLLQSDFYNKYNNKFDEIYNSLPEDKGMAYDRSQDDPFWIWSQSVKNTSEIPFTFSDGSSSPITIFVDNDNKLYIQGSTELQAQSEVAQSLLMNAGDMFTFTPDAANNVNILLKTKANADDVSIEILGKTEVTGTLKIENIFYIKADKILTGQFDIARIPFISHVGRLLEPFLPFQYSLLTNDGFRYTVTPTITDSTLSHYHRINVDKSGNGVTTDTLIGDDVVFYATGNNDEAIYIAHYHPVINYEIIEVDQVGLSKWLPDIESSVHTHNVITSVRGDNKIVYSMLEDATGNIYAGTSNGFMIIPSQSAYLFVINGYDYYEYGSDLWSLFIKSKNEYEKETELLFPISESVYRDQIELAETDLVNDGDSAMIYGVPLPNQPRDETLIRRVFSFNVPNFKYVLSKDAVDVLDTETIIGVKRVKISDGEEIDISTWTKEDEKISPTKELTIVERDFNDVPIWSIASKVVIDPDVSGYNVDVLVVGSDLIAKNRNLNTNVNQIWDGSSFPLSVGVVRQVIKVATGDYWAASDAGVIVSRDYNEGTVFEIVAIPGGNPNIQGLVEGDGNSIFAISEAGIFVTEDGGKSWDKVFDVTSGFNRITRDYSQSESTLYVTDYANLIWKSIDNGVTWNAFGALPIGETSEIGEIAAGFGFVFIGGVDGSYKTVDGNNWKKVLDKRAYSFQWNYNFTNLMIGVDSAIYSTDDGFIFEKLHSFDGLPMPIVTNDSLRRYFGYAYSNKGKQIHFKSDTGIFSNQLVLVDFNRWISENGQWKENSPYDIYVDNKRVLSTKFNEDKRELYGYKFEVNPITGIIDFSAQSELKEDVRIGDLTISVEDVHGFSVGDRVLIETNFKPGPIPSKSTNQTDAEYGVIVNEYLRDLQSIESTATFAVIEAISRNRLTFTNLLYSDINLPATVFKVANIDGNSSILVNIYESQLSSIGDLTHDQLEDKLSYASDGRPYKFNDTYLSNLLQLTQAVRYVYPDINSEFINDMFYDFRYQSVENPTYPPITDFIDISTSNIYSQQFYNTDFSRVFAKAVNKILIGYGNFAGNIFVATDLGLFWAKTEVNFEANWFYVAGIPYSVYDLLIFGDKIIAATAQGSYSSYDMKIWNVEASLFSQYSAYSLGLRWLDQTIVTVPTHDATFVSEMDSEDEDGIGYITASTGTPYGILQNGQGIKISNAGDKDGDYIIQSITDTGNGYGSGLTVSNAFSGLDGLRTNIDITMGTWWQQWDGDLNEENSNLTNTMFIGGQGRIAYSITNRGSDFAWAEAIVSVSDFICKYFLPASNGLMLLAAPGTSIVSRRNYILQSKDIGKTWDIFKSFESVEGSVINVSISEDNNTVITISYLKPENYKYVDGILTGRPASISDPNGIMSLYSSYIVWNERKGDKDIITIYGAEAANYANGNNIVIFPFKINTILETKEHSLFLGSNQGIYYDVNTVINNSNPQGSIRSVGYNGVVQQIDISGSIKSMTINSVTKNTVFSIATNRTISTNEAIGQKIYITDSSPVEEYTIIANIGTTPGEESTVEIDGLIVANYIGKKFVIVGDTSRVYVNFDLPVAIDQFNGGTLYVTSNENYNIGSTYNIVSNSTTYIDLAVAIIPTSTYLASQGDLSLQVGQSISLLDSMGNIVLWVSLDRKIANNSLKGLEFKRDNYTSTASQLKDMNILSNTRNSITLNAININNQLNAIKNRAVTSGVPVSQLTTLSAVFIFQAGDNFRLDGMLLQPLSGFANKQTSIDSDHQHNVEMVNSIISGKIGSFGGNNSSYVDINVVDTENFDLEIVQRDADLFKGAKIVFTNEESYNLEYELEVVSITSNSIIVRLKSEDYWDFINYSPLAISVGWDWKIDANNYGYTENITYKDFVVQESFVLGKIDRGDIEVVIEDTSNILIGDRVELQDDTLSTEMHIVDSIIDAQTISVVNSVSRTYYESRNPQLKVLRNSFSNTHIHKIRNNEVEILNISAYLNNGYFATHTHRVLALIADVSGLLDKDGEIIVVGSSEKIYNSLDNGVTWGQIANLNSFLDGDIPVTGISTAVIDDSQILAGATNGRIFVQSNPNEEIVRLIEPEVIV